LRRNDVGWSPFNGDGTHRQLKGWHYTGTMRDA
jgi:hypothetical protein